MDRHFQTTDLSQQLLTADGGSKDNSQENFQSVDGWVDASTMIGRVVYPEKWTYSNYSHAVYHDHALGHKETVWKITDILGTWGYPNWFYVAPAPNPPSDSFPQFSKLPAELRFKIWRFALPDPRVVEISVCSSDTRSQAGFRRTLTLRISLSQEQSPLKTRLLLACKESYKVFFENYTPVGYEGPPNGLAHEGGDWSKSYIRTIRCPQAPNLIDFKRDTVLITPSTLMYWESELGLKLSLSKAKSIALTVGRGLNFGLYCDFVHHYCPSVKNLSIVVEKTEIDPQHSGDERSSCFDIDHGFNYKHVSLYAGHNHLLEINSKFTEEFSQRRVHLKDSLERLDYIHLTGDPAEFYQRRIDLKDSNPLDYIRLAEELTIEFASVIEQNPNFWKDVKFSVSMLAILQNSEVRRDLVCDRVGLIPEDIETYETYKPYYTYYTYKALESAHMWIEGLNTYVPCNEDGTLFGSDRYAGIASLFDEVESVEEVGRVVEDEIESDGIQDIEHDFPLPSWVTDILYG